jgi:hypothetical protein
MIKPILIAACACLALTSAALAVPLSPSAKPVLSVASDLVQVKKYKRKHYKHYNDYRKHYRHYHGRYRYGGRYWGRRYDYRPLRWRPWGCIAAGPVWYCP